MISLNLFAVFRRRRVTSIALSVKAAILEESVVIRRDLEGALGLLTDQVDRELERVSVVAQRFDRVTNDVEHVKHLLVLNGESLRSFREEFEEAKQVQNALETELGALVEDLRLIRDQMNELAITSTDDVRALTAQTQSLQNQLQCVVNLYERDK